MQIMIKMHMLIYIYEQVTGLIILPLDLGLLLLLPDLVGMKVS